MFIEALFAVVQTRRQSKLPAVVKLIKKMWYVNTHPHTQLLRTEQVEEGEGAL